MKWELGRKVIVVVLIGSSVFLPAQQTLAASIPTAQNAEGSSARAPAVIRDVALQPGGSLRGQVLDAQGQPCPDLTVQIAKTGASGERLVAVRTNPEGRFQVAGLSGGIHAIQTPQGGALCRLWGPDTAPPAAVSDVLLVAANGPVRGQSGESPIMLGPLEWAFLGAAITAAIAIPLCLSHRNNEAS